MAAGQAIRLLALAHRRMLATSVTLPLEILRAAADASTQRPRRYVELAMASRQGGMIELADGLSISTQPELSLIHI